MVLSFKNYGIQNPFAMIAGTGYRRYCMFGCTVQSARRILIPTMAHLKGSLLLFSFLFITTASCGQNSDNAKAKRPVATIDGQTIYDEDLATSVQGQLLGLRKQEYEIKKKALDNLIEQKLLEAAAKKQGLTTEKLLAQEVDSKVPEPSDAEIGCFYLAVKERMNRPLDEVKTQLRASVKNARTQQARQEYLKRLRTEANVAVLLAPPKFEVAFDPARVRGNRRAPVMIVEFSDYQCPYCRQSEATIKQVMEKYGEKVSLAYRDFPLTAIHSQAMMAAQATRCAVEQGKFWEYHDQLFANSKLERDDLIGYARNLKLDDKQFESCLASEKYKSDIEKDEQEGRKAGITGTPAFFINGVSLSGAQGLDAFAGIIDDELARKSRHPSASVSISRATP
jgi:protein-disulfide isomerase